MIPGSATGKGLLLHGRCHLHRLLCQRRRDCPHSRVHLGLPWHRLRLIGWKKIHFKFQKIFSFLGNWVWAIFWLATHTIVYAAVVFGMMKAKKSFLLPALTVNVFGVIIGIIEAIVNVFLFNWIE